MILLNLFGLGRGLRQVRPLAAVLGAFVLVAQPGGSPAAAPANLLQDAAFSEPLGSTWHVTTPSFKIGTDLGQPALIFTGNGSAEGVYAASSAIAVVPGSEYRLSLHTDASGASVPIDAFVTSEDQKQYFVRARQDAGRSGTVGALFVPKSGVRRVVVLLVPSGPMRPGELASWSQLLFAQVERVSAQAPADDVAAALLRAHPTRESQWPTVFTLAGSGHSGVADGAASSAEFIEPFGVAFDRSGNVIVVDRAGQRIKRILPGGRVETVAGGGSPVAPGLGVPAGYHDGTASTARFNAPSAAAVGPDDAIYVADTKNRCIRRIAGDIVTTFAGSPSRIGPVDGSHDVAAFYAPRSLAFDEAGNLYVADRSAVRVVTPAGVVSSRKFDSPVVSVAVANGSFGSVLFVATEKSIDSIDAATSALIASLPLSLEAFSAAQPRGLVSAIAAPSRNELYVADGANHTVRILHFWSLGTDAETRPIVGEPLEAAGTLGGGFADGSGDRAQMDEPMGIAVAPSGAVVVADTGNKRIRVIGPFVDKSRPLAISTDTEEPPGERKPGVYRVAIVGNSYVWPPIGWDDSIPGRVERRLREAFAAHGCGAQVRLYPISKPGIMLGPALSLIEEKLSFENLDAIVFDVPESGENIASAPAVNFAPGWEKPFIASLERIDADLKENGTLFLVTFHPDAADVPGETLYQKVPQTHIVRGDETTLEDPAEVIHAYDEMLAAVKASHVLYADAWPAMLAESASPEHRPLYGTWDHHLTPHGSAIVADAVLAGLESREPWRAACPAK